MNSSPKKKIDISLIDTKNNPIQNAEVLFYNIYQNELSDYCNTDCQGNNSIELEPGNYLVIITVKEKHKWYQSPKHEITIDFFINIPNDINKHEYNLTELIFTITDYQI